MNGRAERPLGCIVRGRDALLVHEGEEVLIVHEERVRQIAHVGVGRVEVPRTEGKQPFLNWQDFRDQFRAGQRRTSRTRILRTLELEPLHGVAIAGRILQTTRGTVQVKPGSLFPALHRLEQEGWIAGEWQQSAGTRRVKTYALTRAGRRQLADEKATWQRIVAAMSQVLDSA